MSELQQNIEDFFETLREIEKKWQKKWFEKDIFKGEIDRSRPKYFVTIPYPYATGALHVGHARTYTLGDVFCRFKRQQGFNTLWPMAFHITGTPVLSISAKIEAGDKKTLDLYRDYVSIYETDEKKVEKILKSFTKPINVANYFSKNMINDFKSMGYSLDIHRQFTTGDPEYNKFIEWQYNHLIKKKLIVKGEYPILWCLKEQNAVGEDDILDADVTKVEVQEFVALKFSLGKDYLVAGTFRPETIYGATNIWLNPTAKYCRVEVDDKETWIISLEAVEKLTHQNHKVKVLDEFVGSELIGKEAFAPRIPDRPLPILPAKFVDPDHATGVVYSVPAHAPYDYIALRDLQEDPTPLEPYPGLKEKVLAIKPIALIKVDSYGEFPAVEIIERMGIKNQDESDKLEKATQEIYSTEFYNGVMMDFTEEFAGLKVEQAKDRVAEVLKAEGRADSFYEVSRKSKSRSGGKIIVAVLPDQYFLNYGDTKWKKKAWKALNQMRIVPEKYRRSFESTFDWLDRRPCVRKRGLGTEFPLTKGQGWIIESLSDSVIYMAFYLVIPYIRKYKIKPEQLLPEVFDYIFLSKGSIATVSKKSGIQETALKEMREEFRYWYPNDLRHTAVAHISNHLSFAIFHHAAIFPAKYWPKCFSLNELLIREGEKMSKSAGNVIPIAHVPKQYSVDVTRLFLVSAGAADTVLNWTEEGIMTIVSRIKKFWTLANEIIEKTSNEDFDLSKASFMTRAFISTVNSRFKKGIDLLESFDARGYVSEVFHLLLKDIEFYIRASSGLPESERNSALRSIIENWIVILSPIIPHITEELNEKLGYKEYCSLRVLPEIKLGEETVLLERQVNFVMNLIEDIKSIVELKRASPEKIFVYIAPDWKHELFSFIGSTLGDEAFNMGKVMSKIKANDNFARKMKIIAKELKSMKGDAKAFRQAFIGSYKELEAVEGYKEYLENLFSSSVECYIGESENIEDPGHRAVRAQPLKPALYIEFK
ncbi:MAG: leucine--tRNA ligase [Candidatus Hodarchaeales archaeon]